MGLICKWFSYAGGNPIQCTPGGGVTIVVVYEPCSSSLYLAALLVWLGRVPHGRSIIDRWSGKGYIMLLPLPMVCIGPGFRHRKPSFPVALIYITFASNHVISINQLNNCTMTHDQSKRCNVPYTVSYAEQYRTKLPCTAQSKP